MLRNDTGTNKIAYSLREAAEVTGLSVTTIHKLCNEGHLKRRKVGKRTFILADDLLGFFRSRDSSKWTGYDGKTSGEEV